MQKEKNSILFELYKPVYYANSNNILQNENTMDR